MQGLIQATEALVWNKVFCPCSHGDTARLLLGFVPGSSLCPSLSALKEEGAGDERASKCSQGWDFPSISFTTRHLLGHDRVGEEEHAGTK